MPMLYVLRLASIRPLVLMPPQLLRLPRMVLRVRMDCANEDRPLTRDSGFCSR